MQTNFCKTCGGDLRREGNHYICQACGNKWTVDAADDVHVVDRANAWAALRDGDFDHAAELFEIIHEKEPKDHEAYWGLALACAGIMYVIDYEEHKKVPTCNNIGEDSFLGSKNVKKAIELAPSDIADSYRQQAEQIEKIRLEWMQKARKEPPYDVFLSYKDSDREHGIDRTQDSVDAQDLYNMLTAEGYKVFFSRISLRDKVSEHYEPYIYNAIRTAKVMIVFGEKAEYFNSTWIRNEWSRFKKRIESGEKHKNSLIVVCKNMNPGDLPVVLRSRQSLNAGDITFGKDLLRHIEMVIAQSKENEHLKKIDFSGGHRGKKATVIAHNTITKREIGQNNATKTSIDEKQSLMLVESYIKEKQWDEANTLLQNVLFNNPSFAEAIWCQLLINQKVTSNAALVRIVDRFKPEDYGLIEKALNCASREFAGRILDLLYQSCRILSNQVREKIYKLILPYRYERRNQRLKENFEWCISNRDFNLFKLLLSGLEESDVDDYIRYNVQYMKATMNHQEKRECTQMLLAVDEGNRDARMFLFESELATATTLSSITEAFENVLKYSADIDQDVAEALTIVAGVMDTPLHCEFAQQLPRYFRGDLNSLRRQLLTLGNRMIEKSFFTEAEAIFHLMLSVDETNADAFWGICMAKTHSVSEEQIVNSSLLLSEQAEYNKYLSLVGEERRVQCMRLAKKQQTTQKSIRRKKVRIAIGVSVSAAVIAGAVATFTFILPSVQLSKANKLFAAGNYSEANNIYQNLGGFGDSTKYAETVKAILQLQSGNQVTAVQTLLAAGVPVEITYQPEGGSLAGTDALVLGHTLSLDGSILPLSTAEASGEAVVNTFNSAAEFTNQLLTPTRDGYRFTGWETGAFSYDTTGKDPVFHMVLKAVWSTQEFVINYHLDGGTVAGTNPVEYGVESPDITLIEPTRTGYDFAGWTWEGQTEPVLNLTIPTGSFGDRVYTANWKPKEVKITLDLAGGTCDVSEVIAVFGQQIELPTPVRPGYAFGDWYNAEKEHFTPGISDLTEDITLQAYWSLEHYAVKYNMNGGTNAEGNPDFYTYEEEFTLAAPTKAGYTFLGWTWEGQTEPVQTADIPLNSVGDREFTANWEKNTLSVSFDAQGGTVSVTTLAVSYGDAWSLPVPVWDGHAFGGWYLDGTRMGEICTLTENCTLTAAWDVIPYTITYHMNGGTNATGNPDTYTCEDKIDLAEPTKPGYRFLGWTYEGQATPVKVLTINKGESGHKEYTANWEAVSAVVTLDANGGTCDSASLTVAYDDLLNLPTPQWDGHTFNGWYMGNVLVESGISRLTENCTLVAHWTSVEYTITYNLNGGTNHPENPAGYTYESDITLQAPVRDGYTFLGWLYSGQDTPVLSVTVVGEMGNKVFTAVWSVNTYQVTLDTAGGTVGSSPLDLALTYDQAYELPTPERAGYTFTGWFYEGNEIAGSGRWNLPADVTLTAGWDAHTYSVTLEDVREFKSTHTVTYHHNYEGAASETRTYRNGDVLTYVFPAARSGYVFAGWYTTEACTGTNYDFSRELTSDLELYAKWIPTNAYCVGSININGSVENITIAVGTEPCYAFVSPVTQLITIYTSHVSGDPIIRLYDADMTVLADNDDDYGNGDAILTWTVTANTLYYIGYSCCADCTGALHLSGGLGDGGAVVADDGDGMSYDPEAPGIDMEVAFGSVVELPVPSREGYVFAGWYAEDGTKADPNSWNIAQNTVLTAHWDAQRYAVTLDAMGGTMDTEDGPVGTLVLDIGYGETYELPTPVKSGSVFLGWFFRDNDEPVDASGIWTRLATGSSQSFAVRAVWMAA